jgi:U4/U6.U5 tri-snRNP component SNU23
VVDDNTDRRSSFINSPHSLSDLRRLGQTTHVARSTVEQVRARIQLLRSQTSSSSSSSAKEYDFLERVKAIADAEREKKEERKRRKREEKERKEREREEERRKEIGGGGVEDEAMMSMMGFGGFGSSKK